MSDGTWRPTSDVAVVHSTPEWLLSDGVIVPERPNDYQGWRLTTDGWLSVVDAPTAGHRSAVLNAQMAGLSAFPRLINHGGVASALP